MQCQLLIGIIFLKEELIFFAKKSKYQISSAKKKGFLQKFPMQVIDNVMRRNLERKKTSLVPEFDELKG